MSQIRSHELVGQATNSGEILEVCKEVFHGGGPDVPTAVLDAHGIDELPVDFILPYHYLVWKLYLLAALVGLVNVQLQQL